MLAKTSDFERNSQFLKTYLTKIEEMIFVKKKYADAKQMLAFTAEKLKADSANVNILMFLTSICLFQMKEFFEFKDLWAKLDHDAILNCENEKMVNLHAKLCDVWRDHNESIGRMARLEDRVNSEADVTLEEIYEIAVMYEVIEPKKALEYLFRIIAKDKNWDNQKALKKAGAVIGNLIDAKAKKEYRDRLRSLVY